MRLHRNRMMLPAAGLTLLVSLCGPIHRSPAQQSDTDVPGSSAPAKANTDSVVPEQAVTKPTGPNPAQPNQAGPDQVVVPLSEPARRWIEEALRRQAANPNAPPLATGDPVLDDVLEVIRRQGSVLDGSALDADLDDLLPRPTERFDIPPPPPRYNNRVSRSGLRSPDEVDRHPDARFHVAESLLRAARDLAALPQRDSTSDQLIAAMREQATMLLVDQYSQDSDRFED